MVSYILQFYRGNTANKYIKKDDNSVSDNRYTKLKLGNVTVCGVGIGETFRLSSQGKRRH